MFERSRTFLTESHEQITRVRHFHPSMAEPVDVDLESGSLTFDEAWSPYAQLRAQLRAPDTADGFDLLDPRAGSRILVDAGYRVGSAEDVELVADLRLDSRTAVRPADTVTVSAMGHELLMQDWSPLAASRTIPTHARAGSTLEGIIRWHDSTADVVLAPGLEVPFMADGDEAIRLDATSDTWDALVDIADRAGDLWVYNDGLGVWQVRRRPSQVGVSEATLAVGENGTVDETDSTLSRADWGNAVVVIHEWTDAGGARRQARGFAVVDSGPLRPGLVGLKAVTIRRTYPGTTASARAAAASLLRRVVTRGRTVDLRAIAAWWLRPGHTVTVQLPQASQQRMLVSRVEFGLTDGAMRVKLRHPEDIIITTGE